MMNKIQDQIIKNKKKIYKLENKRELIYRCLAGGLVAIFVTGVPAFASFFMPIPTAAVLGTYAASNIFTISCLIYGINIETKKQKLEKETISLKKQISYLAEETKTTLYTKEKDNQQSLQNENNYSQEYFQPKNHTKTLVKKLK